MKNILNRFQQFGIIPVVKIDNAAEAAPLAKALCDGGLSVAEVTFRTDAAEDAIRNMIEACPDMLVGAGTVLTIEQVDKALSVGAQFIVSPGLNPKIVKYCESGNIPIIPGISTPTDMEQAIELGLEAVKFFPAEASGGLDKIKAMSAPYANMLFMPTGGIHSGNLVSYLDFPKVIACGGSWMVSDELIHKKQFDQIKTMTTEAINTMLGFELKSIGIPAEPNQANAIADTFEKAFGFKKVNKDKSLFAGDTIEVINQSSYGTKGQITIQTHYIDRAIYYLQRQKIEFNENTMQYTNGKINKIYLKEEMGGFAVHLIQRDKTRN